MILDKTGKPMPEGVDGGESPENVCSPALIHILTQNQATYRLFGANLATCDVANSELPPAAVRAQNDLIADTVRRVASNNLDSRMTFVASNKRPSRSL